MAAAIAARPKLGCEEAAQLARDLFNVVGTVTELGSHQDRNFKIVTDAGAFVLRIANASWAKPALEAQDAVLPHLAAQGLTVSRALPSTDGTNIRTVEVSGQPAHVRLLSFVEGAPLSDAVYLAPCVMRDLGTLAGRTAAALTDFQHPGLDRPGTQWDMQNARRIITDLLPSVSDKGARAAVGAAAEGAWAVVSKLAPSLRTQAIHCDITDFNVVCKRDEANRLRPYAVIDFGDLVRSWLVSDVAIMVASLLRHTTTTPPGAALQAILPAVAAYHAVMPLTQAEVASLWPLVVLRGAVLVVSGEHQARLDPDNPSVIRPLPGEHRIFATAAATPFPLAEAAIRHALGMPPAHDVAAQLASAVPLLPSVDGTGITALDLSATSDHLRSGTYLRGQALELELLQAVASGAVARAAATRWGEARLTRTVHNSAAEPSTVATSVQAMLPAAAPVCAPWKGTLLAVGDSAVSLVVESGLVLRLSGLVPAAALAAGATVEAGQQLGAVPAAAAAAADAHAHAHAPLDIQLCTDATLPAPAFVPGSLFGAWSTLCPDPSPLLRCNLSAPADCSEALLQRRDRHFAKVQEHYYTDPMRIERGWKHHLLDTTSARAYVDMVNNVAAIGHSHPRLAAALHKQMHLLNTNSRFHYAAVAELCERLAAHAPPELDTVLLVCSGSEAVDLALRIAQTVTDRMDVIAVREAYHGWTYLSDAVTTSLYDNPRALETRPEWIHLAPAPNSYRGKYRGTEAAAAGYAADTTALVEAMVAAGKPPAAFICEPLFGNAGGVVLPAGYLSSAYSAVRAAGGLCIADEVQVGYGRTGHTFWAHEAHGVVPDMITIAKAMGNGYPVGAVITKRSIAEAFQSLNARFFSSAGGSPAACVASLAVLDVLRDERLQDNARIVGQRLIERCTELMSRYPLVGAVHGLGLYVGIELVKDRDSREPATAECYAICDRLRELGCVVQPTGERANILKAKPPMCLDEEAADFFVAQLEAALRDGW